MQFIDKVRIYLRAGKGGDGCLSFRREKYVAFGGPNGGNGGRGGDIYLQASHNRTTLLDLAHHPHWIAGDGKNGQGSDCFGAQGEDLIVQVPCGTLLYKEGRLLADLKEHGRKFLAAGGGKGGRGNAAFKSNANKAPRIREKGEPGEEPVLDLELKLLADVGLVGFPNAGKSTFLASVSNARPKIADYPFTTLSPNLGMVGHKGRSFVLADIPGLIEGASSGKGLGHDFLRHVERTRVLIHLIDPLGFKECSPWKGLKIIERELKTFHPDLARKPRLLVVTKMDLPEAQEALKSLRLHCKGKRLFLISAATRKGVPELLNEVIRVLSRVQEEPAVLRQAREEEVESRPQKILKSTRVERQGRAQYRIWGAELERLAQMTDFRLPEGSARFRDYLKKWGVEKKLLRMGAGPGSLVQIGKVEFEWMAEETKEKRGRHA